MLYYYRYHTTNKIFIVRVSYVTRCDWLWSIFLRPQQQHQMQNNANIAIISVTIDAAIPKPIPSLSEGHLRCILHYMYDLQSIF